ncbi:DNA helicase MCM8 [Halyomorpha halys]|uniref:DNA helicase MCM8 n=1 Tax=Halyomorpha halys TaxID=286706 RepID=UPI0006D4FEA9
MSLALHQTVSVILKSEDEAEFPSVKVRFINFESITPIKDIKAGLYGKLISVRGTVIRVSGNKLICVSMGFGCNTCYATMSIPLKDGVYKMPASCKADNCRSKSFTPLCSSNLSRTKSYQIMKVQESVADEQSEGGRVPRTIEVDLTDDLVDSCGPGDNVTIVGIVKIRNSEENRKSKSANLFTLYVDAVSVVNSKSGVNSGRQSLCSVEFSIKDYYAIQEIHAEEARFRLLVNSLCPTVYGHEMVKAGLLLALVGGSSTNRRADAHVLVVGDPGLGKSHLLHACAQVSPRGVYVCGNTTSSSGLTVTLVKESGGDFALEAGALVLANHGCCCIDEFDKMTNQHQALLEAMEQQRISVAKGGVVCSLPAHASILAAANPVGGHYNRTKTIAENLKMSAALLSRFDLIFILLDRPDEHLDSMLSEHVMTLHAGLKGKNKLMSASSMCSSSFIADTDESKQPLSDRLKLKYGEPIDLVPHSLLRKYIAYVRKYVPNPKLSVEAAKVLQDFYLELRKMQDTTPVTTRQLESMIRLTQARAKLELREEATSDDANDIVELLKWSMRDVVTGNLDPNLSQNGRGMSQGSKAKKFIGALQKKASFENKDTFSVAEMKDLIKSLNLQVQDFYQFISILNVQGFIIKRGSDKYKLLSV